MGGAAGLGCRVGLPANARYHAEGTVSVLRNPRNASQLLWLVSLIGACSSSSMGSPGETPDVDAGLESSGEGGAGGSSGDSASGSAAPDAPTGSSSSGGGSSTSGGASDPGGGDSGPS